MKIIKQLIIISGICLTGEVIVSILPFAFPSSVISLILVAVLLIVGWLKEEHIQESADFLMGTMAMFFLPLNIGIFEELEALQGQVAIIIVIALISLVITFLSATGAAILTKKIMNRIAKRKLEQEGL